MMMWLTIVDVIDSSLVMIVLIFCYAAYAKPSKMMIICSAPTDIVPVPFFVCLCQSSTERAEIIRPKSRLVCHYWTSLHILHNSYI